MVPYAVNFDGTVNSPGCHWTVSLASCSRQSPSPRLKPQTPAGQEVVNALQCRLQSLPLSDGLKSPSRNGLISLDVTPQPGPRALIPSAHSNSLLRHFNITKQLQLQLATATDAMLPQANQHLPQTRTLPTAPAPVANSI